MLLQSLLFQAITLSLVLASSDGAPRTHKRARRTLQEFESGTTLPDRDLVHVRRTDIAASADVSDSPLVSSAIGLVGVEGTAIPTGALVSAATSVVAGGVPGGLPTAVLRFAAMSELPAAVIAERQLVPSDLPSLPVPSLLAGLPTEISLPAALPTTPAGLLSALPLPLLEPSGTPILPRQVPDLATIPADLDSAGLPIPTQSFVGELPPIASSLGALPIPEDVLPTAILSEVPLPTPTAALATIL
ncbi:hypothetical protein RQP46_008078 [Phenoliferia psychrophenolica]